MVVADPDATLLTTCEHGYGKRTPFGPNSPADENGTEEGEPTAESPAEATAESAGESEESEVSSSARYRTQKRGGKGLRDIKATKRNGRVIGITRVDDDDEVIMMTSRGKLQRIRAAEISVIGRNTQGVRVMTLDDDDTLAAVVRVPKEDNGDEEIADETNPASPALPGPPASPRLTNSSEQSDVESSDGEVDDVRTDDEVQDE
jgi:DNA gyrase subunit A